MNGEKLRFIPETENEMSEGVFFSSLSTALVLSMQFLTTILGLYTNRSSGFFPILLIVTVSCMAASVVFQPIEGFTGESLVCFALVTAFYFVPKLSNPYSCAVTTIRFVGMCLVPFCCGVFIRPNYRLVLKICMLFLLASMPVFNRVFLKGNYGSNYDAVSMGTSYAILPVMGASVVHFFFYRKTSTLIEKCCYAVGLLYIVRFITMSYRGALLSLIVVILLAWMSAQTGEDAGRRVAIVAVGALTAIVLYLLIGEPLLEALRGFLDDQGIHVAFLDKMVSLSSDGNVTNGRTDIWLDALDGIMQSPIWGHGSATFKYYTGHAYPHNLLLQFLFDGGVILTGPLMFTLIRGMGFAYENLRPKEREKFAFLLLCFSSSVIRMLVSAEVWEVIIFWLLMGVLANREYWLDE